jgi:hypothetical protein
LQASVWLAGPFILLSLGLANLCGRLPLAIVALFVAFIPSAISGNLSALDSRANLRVRAGLDFLAAVAMSGVLVVEHSALPLWLVIIGAVFAAWSLFSGAVLLYIRRRVREKARID